MPFLYILHCFILKSGIRGMFLQRNWWQEVYKPQWLPILQFLPWSPEWTWYNNKPTLFYSVLIRILWAQLFTFSDLKFLKVIVGAHAVMANGGVIAPVGLNMVALAAQRHAVPFVVVAGSHKVLSVWACHNSGWRVGLQDKKIVNLLLYSAYVGHIGFHS